MIRRLAISLGAATLAVSMATATALAGNPSGTGQPSTSCDFVALAPAGFSSGGFLNHAEAHYANPGSQGSVSSGNLHVVSQYDVACYQVSLHH